MKIHLPAALVLALSCGVPVGCSESPSSRPDAAPTQRDSTAADHGQTVDTSSENDSSTAGNDDSAGTPEVCSNGPLTQWEQKILDMHNQWRGSVDPPAANMYRVRWDKNIAVNAAKWVSSCDPDWPHSPESARKGIGGYEILGENLSYCAGSGCEQDPQITDGSGVGEYGQGWWDERKDYDWATDSSSGFTSHYIQMVSSNIYAMGCAAQLCPKPGPDGWDGEWWWFICQYGPRGQGYWNGTKPYQTGAGGLVEPDESVYAAHPGLCKGTP